MIAAAMPRTTALVEGQSVAYGFLDIASTPSVKSAQDANGSGDYWSGFRGDRTFDRFTDAERAFIAQRDSFYMATVSETGWPYIQHRGGPAGFLKVLDEKTLGFADFRGNRQYISVGNIAANDRAALILVDYPRRSRLKIYAHTEVKDLRDDAELAERLALPGTRARSSGPSCFASMRSTGIARNTSRRASQRRSLRRLWRPLGSGSKLWRKRTGGFARL